VWVVAIAGAVLVGTLSHASSPYGWLGIVLVVSVFVTFIIQLALSTKEGLVLRTAASIGGAVVVLAVATAVLTLLDA
jgi:hypothetical protein